MTGGFGGLLPARSLGIGLSFGIAVTALAYAIGPVSGAHLNPAATPWTPPTRAALYPVSHIAAVLNEGLQMAHLVLIGCRRANRSRVQALQWSPDVGLDPRPLQKHTELPVGLRRHSEAIASARSRRSQSGDRGYIGEDGIREDGPDRADGRVVAKALERIAPGREAAASQTYAARR
ncbi:aquaporin [Mesorhizobium sp. M0633]